MLWTSVVNRAPRPRRGARPRTPAGGQAPEQQPGFLEGLADRRDEEARRVRRLQGLAQAVLQGGGVRGQQRAGRRRAVGLVQPAAGKDMRAGHEVHHAAALDEVDLQGPARGVAQHDHGRGVARLGAGGPRRGRGVVSSLTV